MDAGAALVALVVTSSTPPATSSTRASCRRHGSPLDWAIDTAGAATVTLLVRRRREKPAADRVERHSRVRARLGLTALATVAVLALRAGPRRDGRGARGGRALGGARARDRIDRARDGAQPDGRARRLRPSRCSRPCAGQLRAVRFALFLIAVHAHFHELRGWPWGVPGSAALVIPGVIRGGADRGRAARVLRDRLRARLPRHGLLDRAAANERVRVEAQAHAGPRRTVRRETEVQAWAEDPRRPVQDLIGLDMILSAANQAAATGEAEAPPASSTSPRPGVAHVRLRDEIVDLAPCPRS